MPCLTLRSVLLVLSRQTTTEKTITYNSLHPNNSKTSVSVAPPVSTRSSNPMIIPAYGRGWLVSFRFLAVLKSQYYPVERVFQMD